MRVFFLFIFLYSLKIIATPFPLKRHEIISEEDKEALYVPFQLKEIIHLEGVNLSLSPLNKVSNKKMIKVLDDLISEYNAYFLNPRNMKTSKKISPKLMTSFYQAFKYFHATLSLTVDTLGPQLNAAKQMHCTGFLKKLYTQVYEKSFKHLQRMTLSIFSNLSHQGKEISYPYGSLAIDIREIQQNGSVKNVQKNLHYFWDENGPVVSVADFGSDIVKFSYGNMIEGIVRTLVIDDNHISSTDGLYLERDLKNGEEVILVKPYKGYNSSQPFRRLSADSTTDLPGLSPEDETSFVGFVTYVPFLNKKTALFAAPRKRDALYLPCHMALGEKSKVNIPFPTEQDLSVLYLEYLEEIIKNPKENKKDLENISKIIDSLPPISYDPQESGSAATAASPEESSAGAKESSSLSPLEQIKALSLKIREDLLQAIVSSGSPERDAELKRQQEFQRRATKQKRKTKGKGKPQRKHSTPSQEGSETAASPAEVAFNSEEILEKVKSEGRVRYKNIQEILNQTRKNLGHYGPHFMEWVRHNLSQRGSHIKIAGNTLVRWHGGKDSSVPADFLNGFVSNLLGTYQQAMGTKA